MEGRTESRRFQVTRALLPTAHTHTEWWLEMERQNKASYHDNLFMPNTVHTHSTCYSTSSIYMAFHMCTLYTGE